MLPVFGLCASYFVLCSLYSVSWRGRQGPVQFASFQFSICNSNQISHPSPSSQRPCPSSRHPTTDRELLPLPALLAEVRVIQVEKRRAVNRSSDRFVQQIIH